LSERPQSAALILKCYFRLSERAQTMKNGPLNEGGPECRKTGSKTSCTKALPSAIAKIGRRLPPEAMGLDEPVVMHRPFRFNRRIYGWKQSGDRWLLVTAGQIVARVVPDHVRPHMHRVALGDGFLSDMVNLARAKDAALSLADRAVETGRLSPHGGPPVCETERAAIPHAPEPPERASEPLGRGADGKGSGAR
jgi:hypothetical protein